MGDNLKQLGKYMKKSHTDADLAIKRTYTTVPASERIRDIFDPDYPFKAIMTKQERSNQVILDINFGKRLPSVECCADCMCGATETFSSDQLVDSKIYLHNAYVANSTVVYLDGSMAVRNTDYIEYNATGIEILVPANAITVSYVYSTGNCQDSACNDTWPCAEFKLITGLATVFYDRFDRSTEFNTGTAGGCGVWRTNTGAITSVFPENGLASLEFNATLGGSTYHVVGQTFEISINQVGMDSGLTNTGLLSAANGGNDVTFFWRRHLNTNTIELSITGQCEGYRVDNGRLDFAGSVFKNVTIPFDVTEDIEVHLAQIPGSWLIKITPQGGEASVGTANLVVTDADIAASIGGEVDNYTNLRLITPTITAVQFSNVDGVQSIAIGAGLDTGRWGVTASANTAYEFSACRKIPGQDNPPFWFGFCSSYFDPVSEGQMGASSRTSLDVNYRADYHFPITIGVPNTVGQGVLSSLNQKIASANIIGSHGIYGSPNQVVVKGEYQVTSGNGGFTVTDGGSLPGISIGFQSYPGNTQPAFNADGFLGVSTGTFNTVTASNQIWYPFEFTMFTSDGCARWGPVITNIEYLASQVNPTDVLIGDGFNFAQILCRNVVYEAVANPECTATPDCGTCDDSRCPDFQDGFTVTYGPDSIGPSFNPLPRTTLSGTNGGIDTETGVTFTAIGDNVGRVSFASNSGFNELNLYYDSPFDCRTDDDNIYQASLEFKLNNTSNVHYTEFLFGGLNGPTVTVSKDGSNSWTVTGSVPNIDISLTDGVWYTFIIQTVGNDFKYSIHPVGSSPVWITVPNLASTDGAGYLRTVWFYSGYQIQGSPEAFDYTMDIRNVNSLGDNSTHSGGGDVGNGGGSGGDGSGGGIIIDPPPGPPIILPPPSGNGRAIGAYVHNWADNFSLFDSYAGVIQRQTSFATTYHHWGTSGGSEWPSSLIAAQEARGITPMLTWEAWNNYTGSSDPAFDLDSTLAGNHDAVLDRWITGARNYGKPIFIRLAHEMNGDWYPWGVKGGHNGNTPTKFANFWRYVVNRFRAGGASNVKWVWAPNVIDNDKPITGLYPGDSYVDLTGMDGYNWGSLQTWRTFTQVFATTYDQILSIAPNVPIIVAETGCAESGGNKASWITTAYTAEIPTRFANLSGVLWFNQNKETDWRVESSAAALAAYRAAVALPEWQGRL